MYIIHLKMDQPDCPVINASRDSEIIYISPFWNFTEKILFARTFVIAKDNDLLQNSLEELENQPNIHNIEVLSRESGRALLKLTMGETIARNIITRNGGFVVGPFIVNSGWEIWQIAFDNKDDMERAVYELEKSPNEFKILKEIGISLEALSKIVNNIEKVTKFFSTLENLSIEEKALLHSAIKLGFYEDPRRITISKLAEEYGFTAAGMSKKIRRIEKKIMSSLQPLLEYAVNDCITKKRLH
ncbi:MAG: helix-turn-helix domain-containing protein [Archaeoglobaceae archaeon]